MQQREGLEPDLTKSPMVLCEEAAACCPPSEALSKKAKIVDYT